MWNRFELNREIILELFNYNKFLLSFTKLCDSLIYIEIKLWDFYIYMYA